MRGLAGAPGSVQRLVGAASKGTCDLCPCSPHPADPRLTTGSAWWSFCRTGLCMTPSLLGRLCMVPRLQSKRRRRRIAVRMTLPDAGHLKMGDIPSAASPGHVLCRVGGGRAPLPRQLWTPAAPATCGQFQGCRRGLQGRQVSGCSVTTRHVQAGGDMSGQNVKALRQQRLPMGTSWRLMPSITACIAPTDTHMQ